MENIRLVKPALLNAGTFEYAVPGGLEVETVFDFNSVGVGLPVAFSAGRGTFKLAHTPRVAEVWALCRAA